MISAAVNSPCTDNPPPDGSSFGHRRSGWRALLAGATVLALTTAHALVVLATARGARRSTQPPHDSLLCICEECCARRHFIRRELAAEARRAAALQGSTERSDQKGEEGQRGHAARLRVVS